MKLSKLLERLDYTCLQGDMNKEITGIYNDSRKVTDGSLFLCIKGAVSDGHTYAAQVSEKGATVIVVQDPVEVPESVTVIQVEDSRYAMAMIAAAWYDYPAEKLRVIGITGTKGKTTTTYMIRSILEAAGHKVGLIGTIEAIIGDKVIPACNTTPESMTIQEYFAEMVQIGCDSVVMEVSSQGLMLHRTAGIQFEIGIFTNLEPDHIGPAEHSSFEEYLECKSRLFRQCKLGIDYHVSGKRNFQVEIDIPGKFSVYNSLAAIAVCNHFGVTDENIVSALRQAKVKGRIEMIKVSDDFTLMIDYAHNAMALESLLTTLKEYHPKRLVCLFGCGGNRSKSRRYEMGEVSGKLADFTIITSDNPRFEDPEAILADIESAISKTEGKYIKITDRKEAIAYAIHHGQPGDVIVLAGKGHEDYQEICGVKHPMDERVLIKEILEEDAAKAIR